MNMFKAVKATSVKEYFEMMPAERSEVFEFLHKFIQQSAPTLNPHFANNMVGYGSFKCKNYKKESIDWPIIGLASHKNYISVYICSVDKEGYLAEKYKDELGNVSVGKSCIRIKKLADLDFKTFKKVLQLAEKSPGLGQDL